MTNFIKGFYFQIRMEIKLRDQHTADIKYYDVFAEDFEKTLTATTSLSLKRPADDNIKVNLATIPQAQKEAFVTALCERYQVHFEVPALDVLLFPTTVCRLVFSQVLRRLT